MHYLTYMIQKKDHGKEVLSILRHELQLSTAKIRSVKWDPAGILLDEKRVTVRQKVEKGQCLKVLLHDAETKEVRILPCSMDLAILYEDSDLLILNKPTGIVCHPSKGHRQDTLANGVCAYFEAKGERSSVHLLGRLDKDTSGILGIAKHSVAAQRMTSSVHKEYLAIIEGHPARQSGWISIPMETYRDPVDHFLKMRKSSHEKTGRANTFYEVLYPVGPYSLCRLTIETGRMHQIRFHMASIGHPLLGDPIYGNGHTNLISRTALHAFQMQFTHPVTGEMISLKTELPSDMEAVINGL